MAIDQYNIISTSAAIASTRHGLAELPFYLPRTDSDPVLYRDPGGCIPRPDFRRLAEHGVQMVLVHKDDYHTCERLLEEKLQEISQDDALLATDKATIVQQIGTNVARDILDGGLSSVTMERASNVVSGVIHAILKDEDVANCLLCMATHERTTASHMFIVSALSIILGREIFGADWTMLSTLGMAGMAHDLGKLAVDRAILTKSGPLTVEEIRLIQRHPVDSVWLLGDDPFVTPAVRQTILEHHERIDGRGYPLGLLGNDLLPTSCVLSIVDSFHALVGQRHYRDSMTPALAMRALNQQRGRQFHSDFLDCWSEMINDMEPASAQVVPVVSEIIASQQEHEPMAHFDRFGQRSTRFRCSNNIGIRCIYTSRLDDATCAPNEFKTTVHDISRRGICLRAEFPMYRGERVFVLLPGIRHPWVKGMIAWCCREGEASFKVGICFERRVNESEIAASIA